MGVLLPGNGSTSDTGIGRFAVVFQDATLLPGQSESGASRRVDDGCDWIKQGRLFELRLDALVLVGTFLCWFHGSWKERWKVFLVEEGFHFKSLSSCNNTEMVSLLEAFTGSWFARAKSNLKEKVTSALLWKTTFRSGVRLFFVKITFMRTFSSQHEYVLGLTSGAEVRHDRWSLELLSPVELALE